MAATSRIWHEQHRTPNGSKNTAGRPVGICHAIRPPEPPWSARTSLCRRSRGAHKESASRARQSVPHNVALASANDLHYFCLPYLPAQKPWCMSSKRRYWHLSPNGFLSKTSFNGRWSGSSPDGMMSIGTFTCHFQFRADGKGTARHGTARLAGIDRSAADWKAVNKKPPQQQIQAAKEFLNKLELEEADTGDVCVNQLLRDRAGKRWRDSIRGEGLG